MEIRQVDVCYNCSNRVKKTCMRLKRQVLMNEHCNLHRTKCVSAIDMVNIEGAYEIFKEKMDRVCAISIGKIVVAGVGGNKFSVVNMDTKSSVCYRINFTNFKNFVCIYMPQFVNGELSRREGSIYETYVPDFKNSSQEVVDELARDIIAEILK